MDIQNKMIHALIDSVDTVSVYFEKNIETEDISGIYLYSSKKEIPYTVKYVCGTRLILKIADLNVKKAYFLSNSEQELQLIPHGVLDSAKYRYPGDDLGAVYTILDYSLDTVQELLDPTLFFRISRSCIVSISSIDSISKH
ncbi:MAG: LytTR family transcriptional regulator DNA-binding domain-containing protein, partial [Spirochaetales bacterium]|nr:LytTR family transcriptional regulator DNA-binding domain-containing protein [Spirochaetales bacterium]